MMENLDQFVAALWVRAYQLAAPDDMIHACSACWQICLFKH
jgi:hypothetical protein